MKTSRIQIYTSDQLASKVAQKADRLGLSISSFAELLIAKGLANKECKDFFDGVEIWSEPPPPDVRRELWFSAREWLNQLITGEYADQKVKSFIGKISNGFEYWFTFVVQPGVEPTNNRAERALREHVVIRKIIGTLRNRKGTYIHERIMTVLATWSQLGLNSLQMLRIKLSS
jgi:hypothetical protein